MGPKKGKGILLAVTPDDEEDAEVEDEEMDDEGASEDEMDAASAFKEALDSGDPAAIVDAFKAMKMACGGEY